MLSLKNIISMFYKEPLNIFYILAKILENNIKTENHLALKKL
jgi:hypothetical protein